VEPEEQSKWFEEILRRLKNVLEDMNSLCSCNTATTADIKKNLGKVEQSVAKCLKTLDSGLKEKKFLDDESSTDRERRLQVPLCATQCVVALCDLLDLLSAHVRLNYTINWGSHLIGDSYFNKYFKMDRLPVKDLEEKSVKLLAPGITRFFFIAIANITTRGVDSRLSDVEHCLSSICTGLGGIWTTNSVIWNKIALVSLSKARENLGIEEDEFQQQVKSKKVLAVRDWSGDEKYPEFQFGENQIISIVQKVLSSSDLDPRTWETVIYLHEVFENKTEESLVTRDLLLAGRWKKEPSEPPINTPLTSRTIETGTALYRIVKSSHSPFFFAQYSESGIGGRFDLPDSGDNGTLYTACSVKGACCEIFRREPNLSLGNLMAKKIWTLRTDCSFDVTDLRSEGAHFPANTVREVTQKIAVEVSEKSNIKGIIAQLRSNASEEGLTLFGPGGSTPPAVAGLGCWEAVSSPLLKHKEVIDFVQEEERRQEFPRIHLNRFPSDLSFTN
jgi:hypothetical protein